MRTLLALISLATLTSVASCSLFLDYSGIDDGCDGACADVLAEDAPQGDASSDASDASDGAVKTDAPVGDGACPAQGGPTPIKIGNYCIDSTEVTSAQYQAFLTAIGQGYTPTKPPGCGTKSSFAPATANNNCTAQTFDPTGHANYPVVCVDWCDASAFCAWAGKRLCGTIGGGAMPFDNNVISSNASEWFGACSGGSNASWFPWGSKTSDDSRCNTLCKNDGGTIAVATDPSCSTPTGIADMGGNVSEWVNACSDNGPSLTDNCWNESDSFINMTAAYCGECYALDERLRGESRSDVGIRCCGDPL